MGFFDFAKKQPKKIDYAEEFKAEFEKVNIERCLEIGKEWENHDKDANFYFGSAMLFFANTQIPIERLVELYKMGIDTPRATNANLAPWYKQTTLDLIEKRAEIEGLTLDQVLNDAPALQDNQDDEDLPEKVDFTVNNLKIHESRTFHLKKNQYDEYTADIDSTSGIFDFCFGGDIITVTYSILDDGSYKDVAVDYNIMDDNYVENIMKHDARFKAQYDLTIKIKGTGFYKSVTSDTTNRIDFAGGPDINHIKKQMLIAIFDFDNNLLVDVSVGDEIKADISKISDSFNPSQREYGIFDMKIKKIEFVSRISKPEGRANILMGDNVQVFKNE